MSATHIIRGLGLVSIWAAVAGAETVDRKDEILILPTFSVTEKRILQEPESWRYAQVNDFEVLSNASDGKTSRLINAFQMFRQALSVAWPVPQRPLRSQLLILCGERSKFDDFLPPPPSTPEGASLFLQNRERAVIIVDMERTLLSLDREDASLPEGQVADFSVSSSRQLYREYIRFLLNGSDTPMPPWLQEGLLQIFMDLEFTDQWVVLGKIDGQTGTALGSYIGELEEEEGDNLSAETMVSDRTFNLALQRRRLLPFDAFFAEKPDPALPSNPAKSTLWAKQAYAFLHLCLYGRGGKYQKPLGRLLQRIQGNGLVTEKIFRDCFGVGFREMARELRGYISFTDHKYQTFSLKRGSRFEIAEIPLREANLGETALIKGAAQRMAGLNTAARDTLHVAYLRGERDPALLAELGMVEQSENRPEHARALLAFALRSGPAAPSAHVALARIELADARARAAELSRTLSLEEAAPIIDRLLATRSLHPALPGTYLTLVETWEACGLIPTAEQLAVLDEGVRLFPRESDLLLKAVQINRWAGIPERAAGIARLGARFSADPFVRQQFERLLEELTPQP